MSDTPPFLHSNLESGMIGQAASQSTLFNATREDLTQAKESKATLFAQENAYESSKPELNIYTVPTGEEPIPTLPDGGFQAWATVVGAFLIQYTTFGYINAFGVYEDFYARFYLTDSTPSKIGWIGGMQIFLCFALGVIPGRLFDRGYFRSLMVAGILMHGIGLFTLSLSHENQYYQVFLAHGIAFGLSCGITYVPSLGIITHYFNERRVLAMGIVSSGSALGAIIHPIMLNHLFSNPRIGFHNGVRISGGLNMALLLIAFALMRTRLPPKPIQRFPILSWIVEPAYGTALLASGLAFLGLFFAPFNLQLYAIMQGVDPDTAFYAISVLNAASFLGRVVPNAFASRLGVCNMATFFVLSTGIITLTMTTIKNLAGVLIFAVAFGFCSGAFISLVPAGVGALSDNPNELGTRLGLFFALGSFMGLFSTPITGAILTSQYHWIRPTLFSGLALFLAGLTFCATTFIMVRKKGTQIV